MAEANLRVVGLVLLFIASTPLISQNQKRADSLYQIYVDYGKEDSVKLRLLHGLAINLPNQDSVYKYSIDLLDLSRKLDFPYYESFAHLHLGISHRFRGNLQESLQSLITCAKIAEREGFDEILGSAYSEIATSYTSNNDYRNALAYSNKAIAIFRALGSTEKLAITLMNVGYEYYTIQEYDTALAYFDEAEPLFEGMNFDIGLAYTIGNRALIFWKKGLTQEAKRDLKVALNMLEPIGDLYGMSDFYIQLGSVHFEDGETREAINNLSLGLEMAASEDLKEQARDACLMLYKLYRVEQNYKKALEYQTQYIALKDSIQDQETTKRLADLRTEFEVGQKQAEVDLANQQKENRQILAIALGAVAILTGIFLVNFYVAYIKRKKLSLELEALNATKDKFFSIVSHDLRGPISAFSGISNIIKGYLKQKSYGELEEMTDLIDKSANSLSKLLDNLLNWAVQQQGQVPYNPSPIDVNEVVQTIMAIFESTASSKDITLANEINRSVFVFADKDTMMTIFRNLVGNALKFTQVGGKVWVEAESRDAQVHVSIHDTGVGMTPEQIEKLFKMKDKRSYGTEGETGLGVGLQLVNEFVALNNGTLAVTSKEGEGSTFIVSLPTPSAAELKKATNTTV